MGFCAPYLTLMKEDAPQRDHSLREVFNALRWFVRAGCPWRMMPNDLPPWYVVFQQTRRWIKAACFEAMAHDLRTVLRMAQAAWEPSAVILDSRTLQSTPESGARAGFDGHKKRKGEVHVAVDTLGHLLALQVLRPMNRTARKWPVGASGSVRDRAERGSGFCQSGIHGARAGPSRCRLGYPPGSHQAARGQARICAAAPALGRGTLLWLGGALPAVGPRLRALGVTLTGYHWRAFVMLMLTNVFGKSS